MLTADELMAKITNVHGDTYKYNLSNFVYVQDKISIKCVEHGWFPQSAYDHYYSGTGCPKCRSSHGERKVRKCLNGKNVVFGEQYKTDECKNERKLPFDFCIFNNDKKPIYSCSIHNKPRTQTPYAFNVSIIIDHYGYKFENNEDLFKKKRDRSLPMLLAEYKKDPKDIHILTHLIKTLSISAETS